PYYRCLGKKAGENSIDNNERDKQRGKGYIKPAHKTQPEFQHDQRKQHRGEQKNGGGIGMVNIIDPCNHQYDDKCTTDQFLVRKKVIFFNEIVQREIRKKASIRNANEEENLFDR